MAKYNLESELENIIEDLIEYLRECDNGIYINTAQLLSKVDYDLEDFDEDDLFTINNALFKAAEKNHIKLDMSAHELSLEGLPFSLDYKVINTDAQIKCPYCGSTDTSRYIYGYPVINDEVQKKLDSGKL
nr:hypothetical protein [Sphaerochaetaceae bacterium]